MLFDRICRDNGIVHRLTAPASPTTTGKIERFHQTLRREFVADHDPFATVDELQAALDDWVAADYNARRPHQSLDMASPVERFAPTPSDDGDLLPLRLPAILSVAPQPPAELDQHQPAPTPPVPWSSPTAVEFDRVVPPSGNMWLAGKQLWLGPARAGMTVRFWADVDVIHLLIAGTRVKSLRSHLTTADLTRLAASGAEPAGPPPLPPPDADDAIEVDRVVSRGGTISLGGRVVLAAEILAGRQVTVRVEPATISFLDPDTRELLRTRPNRLEPARLLRLRGVRPAGPPPRPMIEPIRVQRRASNRGVIMVVGQKIALGRIHARQVVTVYVADRTLTIDLGDDTRTVTRTTTAVVKSYKAQRPRKVAL